MDEKSTVLSDSYQKFNNVEIHFDIEKGDMVMDNFIIPIDFTRDIERIVGFLPGRDFDINLNPNL